MMHFLLIIFELARKEMRRNHETKTSISYFIFQQERKEKERIQA
jgi:hypothetical protein